VPRVDDDAREPARDAGIGASAAGVACAPAGVMRRLAADVLGGEWRERAEGALIHVERFYPADEKYGRGTIGAIVDRLRQGAEALDVLGRAWPSANGVAGAGAVPDLCFLDLETTGLAGGAGTQAFLVGCATVERDGLRVRQFLLPAFEHERALLAEVGAWVDARRALVTFNGRSFDVPLIETRFLYHRLRFPFEEVPHLDMLHPARRLWKARPAIAAPPLDDESCRLSVLERHIAGVHRVGDVPGFEIPSRYFQFVRDGDAGPLEAVLEHNRLDLLSLALVTAHAIGLIERGPAATAHAHECLGLGRVYERAGRMEEAEACFLHAARWTSLVGRDSHTRADALRRLAVCRRRSGRLADAAEAWRELADLPGCPAALRREAREALAIFYEHRVRDLARARHIALELLAETDQGRWRASIEHRLGRLERKQQARHRGGLMAVLDD
jgi:uncharacterized protein YprB with RNaseH-like and TPR domain